MNSPLRLLHVEDSDGDHALIVRALEQAGYGVQGIRVETEAALRAALAESAWDVVLCDCGLPQLSASVALAVVRESGLGLPVVIVSGSIGESTAVSLIKEGAADCVMKDNLARLGPAIDRARQEARLRREHAQAEAALRAQNEELNRFNRAAVNRELRMIELKQEVNALQARLGEPPRYAIPPAVAGPQPPDELPR